MAASKSVPRSRAAAVVRYGFAGPAPVSFFGSLRQYLPMAIKPPALQSKPPRHGIARVISKLGIASRTQAARWVREGRVRVNGELVRDAEFPVIQGLDRICVDGREPVSAARLVIMLNKPRGLVTTANDDQGRDTVYRCLQGAALPWLAPVGRLDKASEGLLLFSNDPAWAARVTDPASGPDKKYHVQIDRLPDAKLLADLEHGALHEGELLAAKAATALRIGERNAWLEIVLDEGRNRQIRRLLAACDVSVLRLVRVAIGSLSLGDLPKGRWRTLTQQEADSI
jgi:23S rRNA pseudouridine2605 synthase